MGRPGKWALVMMMNYSADCNIFFPDFFKEKCSFVSVRDGRGTRLNRLLASAPWFISIWISISCDGRVVWIFFAGFLLGRFTGKFTSWTIPLGSDIFSVSVESIMHRRVERRIRFGTRTSFKMNHFEIDLRGRDIGRRLRLNSHLSGHSIFKQFKSPLIFNQISISCILFDSFFDGLQLWFWVQSERMNRSAANSQNVSAGVSATMRGPLLFRDFATERLLWWN